MSGSHAESRVPTCQRLSAHASASAASVVDWNAPGRSAPPQAAGYLVQVNAVSMRREDSGGMCPLRT